MSGTLDLSYGCVVEDAINQSGYFVITKNCINGDAFEIYECDENGNFNALSKPMIVDSKTLLAFHAGFFEANHMINHASFSCLD